MLNTASMLDFTQRLIRQPSFSGEEELVTQIILGEMERLKFDHVWRDENGSAIGLIEGAQSGQTLLFDAHTDTVGIAPGSVWTRNSGFVPLRAWRCRHEGRVGCHGACGC